MVFSAYDPFTTNYSEEDRMSKLDNDFTWTLAELLLDLNALNAVISEVQGIRGAVSGKELPEEVEKRVRDTLRYIATSGEELRTTLKELRQLAEARKRETAELP